MKPCRHCGVNANITDDLLGLCPQCNNLFEACANCPHCNRSVLFIDGCKARRWANATHHEKAHCIAANEAILGSALLAVKYATLIWNGFSADGVPNMPTSSPYPEFCDDPDDAEDRIACNPHVRPIGALK